MTKMAQTYYMVDLRPEQRITSEQLKDKLAKEKVYIVDVRFPNEIQGTIQAYKYVNIPLPELVNSLQLSAENFELKFGVDKPPADGRNVVFHCGKGARGSMATELAAKLGFFKAQNLDGGYNNYE